MPHGRPTSAMVSKNWWSACWRGDGGRRDRPPPSLSGRRPDGAQPRDALARAVAQMASAWLFKATRTRWRMINVAAQLFVIAPVNVLGAGLGAVLPGQPDFYLDNVVLARKRPPE